MTNLTANELNIKTNHNSDQTPLVSVVIPVINGERFIRDAIDSALNQSHPRIECIVSDGGSTDGTLDILRTYGDRISWFSKPDKGHADAINKGWRQSKGSILAWLNADDAWTAPDAAKLAVEHLVAHPNVDLVYGDCDVISEQGRTIGRAYLREWDLAYAIREADHCIPQPAAFIRRSAIDRVGMLNTNIFTKDRELWLRIGLSGNIEHIHTTLGVARDTKGISFDGRLVAPAIVQVTKAFYALPDVPPDLLRIKRLALSNAHLRAAYYASEGGSLWRLVILHTLLAILIDPLNIPGVWRKTAYLFRRRRYVRRFPEAVAIVRDKAATRQTAALTSQPS